MQVADLAPSFSGVKTDQFRSPNRASKCVKPELQPNTFLEPGLGHLPRKRSCCYKCKKNRGFGPRSPPVPSVQLDKNRSARRVLRVQKELPRVAQSGFRV